MLKTFYCTTLKLFCDWQHCYFVISFQCQTKDGSIQPARSAICWPSRTTSFLVRQLVLVQRIHYVWWNKKVHRCLKNSTPLTLPRARSLLSLRWCFKVILLSARCD